VAQAIEHFVQPKGEFTLVIEGAQDQRLEAPTAEAESLLKQLHPQGLGAKESVALVVAATGMPRREVYRLWLKQIDTRQRTATTP